MNTKTIVSMIFLCLQCFISNYAYAQWGCSDEVQQKIKSIVAATSAKTPREGGMKITTEYVAKKPGTENVNYSLADSYSYMKSESMEMISTDSVIISIVHSSKQVLIQRPVPRQDSVDMVAKLLQTIIDDKGKTVKCIESKDGFTLVQRTPHKIQGETLPGMVTDSIRIDVKWAQDIPYEIIIYPDTRTGVRTVTYTDMRLALAKNQNAKSFKKNPWSLVYVKATSIKPALKDYKIVDLRN